MRWGGCVPWGNGRSRLTSCHEEDKDKKNLEGDEARGIHCEDYNCP